MSKVQFIKHGKDKIPYRISYRSLSEWQKETGKGLKDLDKIDDDLALIEPLFFHSVETGYLAINQKCPHTREGLQNILDECWLEFLGGIGSFFQTGVNPKK
jgi:hypothetical protein